MYIINKKEKYIDSFKFSCNIFGILYTLVSKNNKYRYPRIITAGNKYEKKAPIIIPHKYGVKNDKIINPKINTNSLHNANNISI